MGRSKCKCFSVNQRLADFHKKIAQPAATSFFCYPKACWKPKSDQLHAFQINKKKAMNAEHSLCRDVERVEVTAFLRFQWLQKKVRPHWRNGSLLGFHLDIHPVYLTLFFLSFPLQVPSFWHANMWVCQEGYL